jgi:beta-lactam-binding protein with PASTA domain
VPDLTGLSARDAVRRLVKLGMSARVTGDGFVVSQTPSAGSPIDGDAVCKLVLERWPTRHAAAANHP